MEKTNEEIIEEMQQVANQMVIDVVVRIKVLPVQFSMEITGFVMTVFYLQKQVLL